MTQFIAEHRHKGMDIVCMGQALADCHTTWKRRIERKISFLKLSMVGMDNKYKWEMYQGAINGLKGDIVFKKIKSGTEKYDSKYFGSYLSHQQTTGNTDVYSDDRVNIFKSKQFTLYLPIFICVIAFAIYFLAGFFSGDSQVVNSKPKEPTNGPVTIDEKSGEKPATNESTKKPDKPKPKPSTDPYDKLRDIIQNNNSLITYEEIYKDRIVDLLVVVESSSKQVIDTFSRDELLVLGYRLKKTRLGIEGYRGKHLAVVFRYKPTQQYFNNTVSDEKYHDLYTSN